jgi:hypothetical protein
MTMRGLKDNGWDETARSSPSYTIDVTLTSYMLGRTGAREEQMA